MATSRGNDPTSIAGEIVEAFNRGDWERLKARVTSDVVYEETGTGRRIEGADAYIQLCMGWKETFADVAGTVRSTAASGTTVALEISGRVLTPVRWWVPGARFLDRQTRPCAGHDVVHRRARSGPRDPPPSRSHDPPAGARCVSRAGTQMSLTSELKASVLLAEALGACRAMQDGSCECSELQYASVPSSVNSPEPDPVIRLSRVVPATSAVPSAVAKRPVPPESPARSRTSPLHRSDP